MEIDDLILAMRDGIFSMKTRRFGTIAELIAEIIFILDPPLNKFHDRFDSKSGERVEVKFSTAMRPNEEPIRMENALEQCLKSTIGDRFIESGEMHACNFDCNIQQVKTSEFEVLYYGMFFSDKVAVFAMSADEVRNCPGYSDKQHKGNVGEGQFHLNPKTIDHHMQNHFVCWLTYAGVYYLLQAEAEKRRREQQEGNGNGISR